MNGDSKAVFLSYASQDAQAAKRICDALRSAGVEVWFDQSELVGGDQWDQKIRKQIKDCALLIPIISAATQARTEGYFRLEWRLADQRTHLMAKGRPFLLPVVIDDTRDADAHVPDSFTEVQWTRLPAGETSSAFAARVKKLLATDGGPSSRAAGSGPKAEAAQELGPPRKPRWLRPVLAATVILIAVVVVTLIKKPNLPDKAALPAGSPASPTITRVTSILGKLDVSRAELDLAADLLAEAAKANPSDAEVFALWARVDCCYLAEYYDRSAARRDAASQHVARAAGLDAANPQVRLARAITMHQLNNDAATSAEASALLESVRRDLPDDPQVYQQLGWAAPDLAAADAWWKQQAQLPGQAVPATFTRALRRLFASDFRGGYALLQEAQTQGKSTKVLLWKSYLEIAWLGDTAAAQRTMAQVPAEALSEDMAASASEWTAYWSRDYERALATAQAIPRDFMESGAGVVSTGYLRGMSLARLGRVTAAEHEWRDALAATERRLATQGNDSALLLNKAVLLAELHDRPAAEQAWRTERELYGDGRGDWLEDYAAARLLSPAEAISRLQNLVHHHQAWMTAAVLRLNPYYDELRNDPRFIALQAEADADPLLSPTAQVLPASPGTQTQNPGPSRPPEADAKSVAVLAFTNLSDDKANEYFSDGISEELLNVLAKIPDLKVAARTSAFYFKGKQVPMAEIAQQLGVAYVVEGSVRKAGDKVRITAQLIKAADGFHVWSDTFTRDLKDIFAVQDEIAGLIATNLEVKMGVTPARPVVDLEAYQEYLTGRAAVAKADMAGLREAVTHFERAVTIEPKFTAGWVQLASAHTQLGRWGGAPTLQAWQAARAAIDKARALEPDSPDVLLALGWIKRTADWDWRGAEQAFRRALQLRPDHPETLAATAVLLFNLGENEESFRLGRRAVQLDPLNAAAQIDLSLMYYFSGNWAESEKLARRALQLAPTGASYHSILAWNLLKQGRDGEASAAAALDTDRVERPMTEGLIAIGRGQNNVARAKLAELEEISRKNGDLADLQNSIAWLSVSLGAKDRAFAALEKARDSRDPSMSWLRNTPYLAPLYGDPRWNALLHEVGLADDQLK